MKKRDKLMAVNSTRLAIDMILLLMYTFISGKFIDKMGVIEYAAPETLSKMGVVFGYVTHMTCLLLIIILLFDLTVYLATYFAEKREAKMSMEIMNEKAESTATTPKKSDKKK